MVYAPMPDNLILIPRPNGGRKELMPPSCPLTSTHTPQHVHCPPNQWIHVKNNKKIKYWLLHSIILWTAFYVIFYSYCYYKEIPLISLCSFLNSSYYREPLSVLIIFQFINSIPKIYHCYSWSYCCFSYLFLTIKPFLDLFH